MLRERERNILYGVRTQHLPLLFHINVLRGAKFMGVKHTLRLQDLYAPLRRIEHIFLL
jgi:hypothetical protein